VIDPQFADATSNRLGIAEIAEPETADANIDPSLRGTIAQPSEPLLVAFSLADLNGGHCHP
jgi:hypothetical protein